MHIYSWKGFKKLKTLYFNTYPFLWKCLGFTYTQRAESWMVLPFECPKTLWLMNGDSSISTLSYFPSSPLYYLWFDRIIGNFIFFLLLIACQAMGRERGGRQSLAKPDFEGRDHISPSISSTILCQQGIKSRDEIAITKKPW